MSGGFVHLHVHSCFSFLDSTMQPEDIAAWARATGAPAIALTDTNCLAGAVIFARAAAEAGVKPILGAEVTEPLPHEREVIRRRVVHRDSPPGPPRFHDMESPQEDEGNEWDTGHPPHGTDCATDSPSISPALMHGNPRRRAALLARNFAGYSAISRICTRRHTNPEFCLMEEIYAAGPDVIVLSDCPAVLRAAARRFAGAGPAACYGILMPSRLRRRRNRAVYETARRLGLLLVVCTDAKIAAPTGDELSLHLLLQAMRRQVTVDQMPGEERLDPAQHLQDAEDITGFFRLGHAAAADSAIFDAIRDAISNTRAIADECNCTLPLGVWKLPDFDDLGDDPAADLRGLVEPGLAARYGSPIPGDAQQRAEIELGVIHQLGFDSYFLLVHRIVQEARTRGFFTLGRGSAANSIVTYALGISNVCPIRHKLHFERFLNPERSVPPDIDVDFSWKERDEILDWCFEYFGRDRVALICTFQTLRLRQAVREAAKAHGLCDSEISAFNRLIETGFRDEEEVPGRPGARRLHDHSEREPWRTILTHAQRLEGFPRHYSVHCGGILITPGPVTDWVPLTTSAKGYLITQIDMHGVEDLGLIKIDLLGNRSLGVLKDAVMLVEQGGGDCGAQDDAPDAATARSSQAFDASTFQREAVRMKMAGTRRGTSVALAGVLESFAGDVHDYPAHDPRPLRERVQDMACVTADAATRELIHEGRTMGVFYVESPGMRALFERLRCRNFDDVVAASSIIRPGVAESGMMAEYVARHQASSMGQPHGAGRRRDGIAIHPVMLQLLPETHGVMVYQEDVLQVAHELAGMTYGEADLLRRAMSGKMRSSEAMARVRGRFIDGAVERGLPAADAEEVWRQVASFVGYSFCKGHSAAFAALSYQVAWLKAHHPAEFLAALLTNEGGFYGSGAYIEEARRWGLDVLGPCVNGSDGEWTGRTTMRHGAFRARGWVRTGLRAVLGLSASGRGRIVAERGRGGAFVSVGDLARRLGRGTRPTLEEWRKLIFAGGADCLAAAGDTPANRRRLFAQFECEWRRCRLEAGSLLGAPAPGPMTREMPAPDDDVIAAREENCRLEMEHLGFMVSGHPLDFADLAPPPGAEVVAAEAMRDHAGKKVFMTGWVIAAKVLRSRNGRGAMKMLTMEDRTATFETVLFPRVYDRMAARTLNRGPFLVEGKVDMALGSPTLNVSNLRGSPRSRAG